ncbi:MAG: sulfate/molybdate ABC transporter ATP-binding protein [Paracoccus sp. (in: a-proteobacteria)]|uniref:sulfate/molybdate ABC transporter ATP-binding protein n=1 Tax=Paracoccus sp. TaxID=267 RepID=UPI004058DFA8
MSITISGMTKRFDRTEVLQGIDLDVADGELVALLGPSGSGKTTLLKIIAGLEWPDAGRLQVAGQDWLQLAARDRRIGFVFQHYALFPHMSVRDNIAFGLEVMPRGQRPSRARIVAKVDELMTFLQIDQLADRYPAQLSGGQRQRVALGRALAIQPRVLLLDEPFGALDAAIRRDLRRWLRGVHEATGSTTIFVTHDQEEAFELADRVVVMGEGRIEQIGHADDIHDHPASPFVARFMGATVELPVTLAAGRATGPGLDLTELPRRALPEGPARIFARPADIRAVPDPAACWTVASLGSTGAELHLTATKTDGTEVEVQMPRRGAPALSRGATVSLRIEAAAVFPDSRREQAAPVLPLRKEIAR